LLRSNFRDIEKLADYLKLTEKQRSVLVTESSFPLNLPLSLAQKIRKGTLDDPILRQFLPISDENIVNQSFVPDPLDEESFRPCNKLLHKYHGRALLLTTQTCAMHCRYCFRRCFDHGTTTPSFAEELAYIAKDPTISEVILSGGDPLILDNVHLESLLSDLSGIPHVRRIRFHTRMPIAFPERIDGTLLKIFDSIPAQIWFVIHTNHPQELDEAIFSSMEDIRRLGIPVLSQTVLLQGVNDNIIALKNLYDMLIDNGIMPYYLFKLDTVTGTTHFHVSEERGLRLMEQLAKQLPGLAIPRYAKEIPDKPCKTIITSC